MPFMLSAPRYRRAPLFSLTAYLAVLATFLTLAPPVLAADALSLAEAQRLAVERSRQIPAQDAAVMAARQRAVAASQLPDPVLKIGVDNLPVSGPDRGSLTADFMTMRRIGVMQEITRSDKRAFRAERYQREADKALAEKDKTTADVERETAIAWLDRYYAEAMASVIASQRVQAQREREAADAAYRAGRASQADVLSARAAVAQFDDRMDDAARRVRSAKIMLARWIGATADQPLSGQPAINTIRLDPASLDTQLAHHPEIAVLNRKADVAATEVKLAEANKKSDWTVEVGYAQRGPGYSNMISVGVSVPLQWDQKNRQDRELAAKFANADQARAERDEMLRAHTAEARVMVAEWESDRERLARYSRELVPLAQERSEATLAAYRGGKSTLAEVLAARRGELDVRLSGLQLEADTARLWAQLNFLFPISHGAMPASSELPENTK